MATKLVTKYMGAFFDIPISTLVQSDLPGET
jgi:hypothetical protein